MLTFNSVILNLDKDIYFHILPSTNRNLTLNIQNTKIKKTEKYQRSQVS